MGTVGVIHPHLEIKIVDPATGKITHYKIPRYFKLVEEFPLTVTGKAQKFQMRQQSTEELSLQDAA